MSDLRKAAEMALEAHDNGYGKIAHDAAIEALREALAQPEWVGLTEEELEGLSDEQIMVAIAAEAALKEKNT